VKHVRIAFTVVACLGAWAFADSWIYPMTPTTTAFEFGKSKFVLDIDGAKNQSFPPHVWSVYLDGAPVARYPNVGVQKVYASEDNQFFVGLSNHGIPGTAFVVFDAQGNLIREQKHRFLPSAMYTSQSVTLVRTWYDADKPDVAFDIKDGQLKGVSVSGSNKQRYDLLKADLGFSTSAPRG
jgi:hypothetical protein